MLSSILSFLFKSGLVLLLLIGGGAIWVLSDDEPVLFQSEESSSEKAGPIFNRVSWKSSAEKDIWIMQQSQNGLNKNFESWDRLVITVDKTGKEKKAIFTQTTPGRIEFAKHYKDIDFRVPCGMCHTNGPRAIRPMVNSKSLAPLKIKDQAKIALWNLRIKLYGRVKSGASTHIEGYPRKVPFNFHGDFAGKALTVNACAQCHNNSWWGRGFLSRQNFPSIRFMIEKGYMPPKGFKFSKQDKKEIKEFLETI